MLVLGLFPGRPVSIIDNQTGQLIGKLTFERMNFNQHNKERISARVSFDFPKRYAILRSEAKIQNLSNET